jgi:hypothetical protein
MFRSRLEASVLPAVGTAIFAGFLFAFVNNLHRVNGVGLVRRQDWPVNALWF